MKGLTTQSKSKAFDLDEIFTDPPNLREYLHHVYKDLSKRSNELDKSLCIYTFQDYLRLPMTISNRIFEATVIGKKLSEDLFISLNMKLFSGDLATRSEVIFFILDEDGDGILKKSDIKFILTQFHMIENKCDVGILHSLINNSLKSNEMTLDDFACNADILLIFLFFFSYYKPFDDETIKCFSSLIHLPYDQRSNKPTHENIFLQSSINLLHYLLEYKDNIRHEEDSEVEDEFWNLKEFELDLTSKMASYNTICTKHKMKKLDLTNLSMMDERFIRQAQPISSANIEVNGNSNPLVHDHDYDSSYASTKDTFEKTSTKLQSPVTKYQGTRELEVYTIHNNTETSYKLTLFKDHLFYFIYDQANLSYVFKGIFLLSYSFVTKIFQDGKYYGLKITSNYNFSYHSCIFLCKFQTELDRFISHIRLGYRKIKTFYDVGEKFANGQFGTIRLGKDIKTGEEVAIKVLNKCGTKKELDMLRWEVEIFKLLKNSHHPNVVRAIDLFESVNSIYLVYEFISSTNLSGYLSNNKITQEIVMKLATEIGSAIAFIHELGILHRDIKTDNIVLTNDQSSFKLIDFGLSKIIAPEEKTSEFYGSLLGTAPEIILQQAHNHKVDVWSFGVLLYFCKFSCYPFDDKEDSYKIAKKIISGKYTIPLNTSDEIVNLIKLCLNVNPSRRITMKALMNELQLYNIN